MCECFLQNAMADLQCELQTLRTRFEESLNSYEDSKKSLGEQVREFNQQKEEAQQEVRGKENQARLFFSSVATTVRVAFLMPLNLTVVLRHNPGSQNTTLKAVRRSFHLHDTTGRLVTSGRGGIPDEPRTGRVGLACEH